MYGNTLASKDRIINEGIEDRRSQLKNERIEDRRSQLKNIK
jgi:hypothetical protein